MSKFKVADSIVCTTRYDSRGHQENYYAWFTIGRRYHVEGFLSGSAMVRDDDGDQTAAPEHAFELAETYCSFGKTAEVAEDKVLQYVREMLEGPKEGDLDSYEAGWEAGFRTALEDLLREVYKLEVKEELVPATRKITFEPFT